MYDFLDPHVVKVLQDYDYWKALHHLSGSRLSVFAFHCPSAEGECQAYYEWADARDSFLRQTLNIENRIRMPGILFFQVDNGEVVDSCLVELKEQTTEEGFLELKGVVKAAAGAISGVEEQHFDNAREIFDLVEQSMNQRKLIQRVVRGTKSAISVRSFLASLLKIIP